MNVATVHMFAKISKTIANFPTKDLSLIIYTSI
jgi:hypothetical protein